MEGGYELVERICQRKGVDKDGATILSAGKDMIKKGRG